MSHWLHLDELRTILDMVLQPYLYASTPSMDFSGGQYICLKVRQEAFTLDHVHPHFQDDERHPNGWHIHIDRDAHDSALPLMLRYLKPELVDALHPALFCWKLEGGG